MKTILYVAILIAVIAAGYFSFKFFSGGQPQANSRLQSGLLPDSSIPSAPSADYSVASTFPTTPTITIGTKNGNGNVEMKNFYANAVDTEEGLTILKDSDQYEISYNRETSGFSLYLKNPASNDVRQNAEADFLNVLGIGQKDACKLNVLVLPPPSAQFAASSGESRQGRGENPNLSFCLNKIQ